MKASRKPDIMGDAAYVIFNRPARECTGNFFIDDEVLKSARHRLRQHAVDPSQKLMPDFFV